MGGDEAQNAGRLLKAMLNAAFWRVFKDGAQLAQKELQPSKEDLWGFSIENPGNLGKMRIWGLGESGRPFPL